MTQFENTAAAEIEMHASGVLSEAISVDKLFSHGDNKPGAVLVVTFMKRNAVKHQVSGQTAACCLVELAVNAGHQRSLATLSSDMMSSVRSVSRLLNCIQLALYAGPLRDSPAC